MELFPSCMVGPGPWLPLHLARIMELPLDLLAGGPINSWTAALLPTLNPSILGSLGYCNVFGWYFRYLQIVKVPGLPNIFLPQLNKAPCTYM